MDFLNTNTLVLGEQTELLTMGVKFSKILDIFIDFVESTVCGGMSEENTSISALDGIFIARRHVIWSGVNFLDVSDSEWSE